MIFSLEWVAEHNDEIYGWISGDGQVQIAPRHLVDFVDNYDWCSFK